ncbi:hypothetical protein [Thermodesulfovibrio sp.]|uniref:hypothetical protein n=1 Tax=Thermodesulfovibrio sp. TaxID=2067987 RepID=UPI0030B3B10B
MKKILATIMSLIFLLPIPICAEQPQDQVQQKYTLTRLLLPNFVYPNCHRVKPADTVIFYLDERFYNSVGSTVAPTSCKGGSVCWSWKVLHGEDPSNIQIYSSELPLKITNLKKLSESISSTIKESQSLRKSSNSLVSAAQEFLNSSFGVGKERGISKERSMTQSESRERGTELNVTPQFHVFLAKGLMGPFWASYPFCIASAVDLFFKAYYSDRSDDLIHAFTIYKSIKPEDIDFSSSNDMLNRAKFLYTIVEQAAYNQLAKDAAWAQAVLFSELLTNWKEFEEVKHFVDSEIQKVYPKYQTLTSKTTAEIAQQDKNLAAIKYNTDKNLKVDDKQIKQKQNEIRDEYLKASIVATTNKATDKENQELEQALAKNDPLVTKKFVQASTVNLNTVKIVIVIAIFTTVILAVVVITRKRKGGKK